MEERKAKKPSGMFEQAALILLHKFLSKDFFVVRTASHDDYVAKVDNLIINKKTGEVICAFDEVHDSKGGEYTTEKLNKVKKIAQQGGAEVIYGLTVKEHKIKQTQIKNVPIFAISLDSRKFKELLPVLLENKLESKSDIEKQVMAEIVKSLNEQMIMLESARIKNRVRDNLDKFKKFLTRITELVANA